MSDKKSTVSKLDIIAEMAQSNEVKQLAKVVKEYVLEQDKSTIGFKKDK